MDLNFAFHTPYSHLLGDYYGDDDGQDDDDDDEDVDHDHYHNHDQYDDVNIHITVSAFYPGLSLSSHGIFSSPDVGQRSDHINMIIIKKLQE